MKKICLFLFAFISFYTFSSLSFRDEAISSIEMERINNRIAEIKNMINVDSKYNQKIAFLIDMKVPSGKNRFFVYDLEKHEVIDQGLVAHGSGSETGIKGMLKFSNLPNSNCTALGRYAVGKT